jgi:hypothetical protein
MYTADKIKLMKDSSAKRVRKRKHLLLDQKKIEKAQKALGARTETETIERALEFVIDEEERLCLQSRNTERQRREI